MEGWLSVAISALLALGSLVASLRRGTARETRMESLVETATQKAGNAESLSRSNSDRIAVLEIHRAVTDERMTRMSEDVREVKALCHEIRDRLPLQPPCPVKPP